MQTDSLGLHFTMLTIGNYPNCEKSTMPLSFANESSILVFLFLREVLEASN